MNSKLSLLLFMFLIIVPLSKSSFFNIFSSKSSFSSIVIPLSGNVFPLGYYSVKLQIGNPPKSYQFDIDTGSDLTWVQCNAPCTSCTLITSLQYNPKSNIVPCSDSICSAHHWPNKPYCPNPKEQCDYEVNYADQSSSMGALVIDQFNFNLLNGSRLQPRLAFGCGYDQSFPSAHPPPVLTAGVLGLGRGKMTLLTQLVSAGLTRNIVGHCLSSKGGGFLFFGDHPIPSTNVAWTPLVSPDNHYTTGPSELLYNGKTTGLKGLKLIFDAGSSYTYFKSNIYQTILMLIRNDLQSTQLKDANEDQTLPICWKGAKPFKSVFDAKHFFKTITIKYTNGKRNTQLQIPPESYLIISKNRNICLGILNGSEVGLQNSNVIGDISMQGIMMIYDNEKKQLGWVSTDCNKLPKS